ncbi:hypothetical protein PC121_g8231, partial [Phytophthora cactorum]
LSATPTPEPRKRGIERDNAVNAKACSNK